MHDFRIICALLLSNADSLARWYQEVRREVCAVSVTLKPHCGRGLWLAHSEPDVAVFLEFITESGTGDFEFYASSVCNLWAQLEYWRESQGLPEFPVLRTASEAMDDVTLRNISPGHSGKLNARPASHSGN